MIQNDSIENNMKMYLDQITKNTDEAYYDMLSIVNYMGPVSYTHLDVYKRQSGNTSTDRRI